MIRRESDGLSFFPNVTVRLWARVTLALLALVSVALAQPSAQAPAPTSLPGAVATAAGLQADNIAVITIHDPIDAAMAKSVVRRLKMAERLGAGVIVIELNTPGGEVGAVLEICNAIKASTVPTIAWINKDAYSGGAIIALACSRLITADPASFGDAMPVAADPIQGIRAAPEQIRQKVLTPLLSEVVDSARRNNQALGRYAYDELIVQGMIVADAQLWLAREKSTGRTVAINRSEFDMLFPGENAETPPRLVGIRAASAPAPATDPSAPANPTTGAAPAPSAASASSVVGASPESVAALGADPSRAAEQVPSQRPVLRAAERANWELLGRISDGSGPLVLKADDLRYFGLASNITPSASAPLDPTRATLNAINSDEQLRAYLGGKHIVRLDQSWSEGLVSFLQNFWVRAILIAVFILGLFIEMVHPGLVVPASLAFLALVGLVAPPFLVGMAAWWEIAAIGAGIALILLEILVIPGFGVTGIAGLILLSAGIVGTFIPAGSGVFPTSPSQRSGLVDGVTALLLAFATAGIGIFFITRYAGSLPFLTKFVLKDPEPFDAQESLFRAIDPEAGNPVRVGDTGLTTTLLRPSGKARFGDRIVNVASELGSIDAGAAVRVTRLADMNIFVERATPTASPTPPPNPPTPGAA
ncbi:MAG: ATP-dependent Clp protease proteolytic subunit [Planctomycetota bacterium]|nr:ATP-dependent Clp protease proteolytic subunit [Planctomycetota bacterium]